MISDKLFLYYNSLTLNGNRYLIENVKNNVNSLIPDLSNIETYLNNY